MIRLKASAGSLFLVASCGMCCQNTAVGQSSDSSSAKNIQELTPHSADRNTLTPPQKVKATLQANGGEHGTVEVKWLPSPEKRVVGYKIIRVDPKEGKPVEVGRSKDATFTMEIGDAKELGDAKKALYGVYLIDYRGNESPISQLATVTKTEKKNP
jgi:hypothetical protein